MKKYILQLQCCICFSSIVLSQNVGIGTITPQAKLHIKGTANTSQLIIDANATQSNTQPLIRLRDASGADLLDIHSDNKFNTFIGFNAGLVNTVSPGLGVANTFIGSSAGFSNSTGFYNTGIGQAALFSNTTGKHNTAIGQAALYSNSQGDYNNALGVKALFSNTTGVNNTATGYNALYSNATGVNNAATGYNALYSNTDGRFNTANGAYALNSNTIGDENTANGYFALASNTTGAYNTANGVAALQKNISGNDNTATGYQALYSNSSGSSNIASGRWALYSNTTGNNNTATGEAALYYNTDGIINTAIGESALKSNTTGDKNTAIGAAALVNNIGGNDNIAIGVRSGTHPNTPDVYNTISIGNDDMLNAYQNQVFIGNTSTAFIGGKVPWSVISDARVKNNIVEDVKGLDFIMKLRPVTYHVSSHAITNLTGNKETPDFAGKYDGDKIKYSGFLAQEVEQASKDAGYEFSGYSSPKNQWSLYTLSYEQFVVPLVKAVQEQQVQQSEIIETAVKQQVIIEEMKIQMAEMKTELELLKKKN